MTSSVVSMLMPAACQCSICDVVENSGTFGCGDGQP